MIAVIYLFEVFVVVQLYLCINNKLISSFQKMNTAIFYGKGNEECRVSCDDSEDELAK